MMPLVYTSRAWWTYDENPALKHRSALALKWLYQSLEIIHSAHTAKYSFINPTSCTSNKHTFTVWWKTILLDVFVTLHYVCLINEYLPVSYDKNWGKSFRVTLSTLLIIYKYWRNTFRITLSPHINNKYWGNIFRVTLRTHNNNNK
jgi:hypothetical protein